MYGKREKPEDIILKLRQVEILQNQGKALADASRGAENLTITYKVRCLPPLPVQKKALLLSLNPQRRGDMVYHV